MTVAEPIRDDPEPFICGPCKVDRHEFAHQTMAGRLLSDQRCVCPCRRAL